MSGGSEHEKIRNLMARYCRLLDSRQFQAWTETFMPDGFFNAIQGRDQIYAYISKAVLATDPTLRRRHVASNIEIEVDGRRARSASEFAYYDRRSPDEPWVWRLGRYDDELGQTPAGDWLFIRRTITPYG